MSLAAEATCETWYEAGTDKDLEVMYLEVMYLEVMYLTCPDAIPVSTTRTRRKSPG
jgi:hypothetical protein